MKKLALVKEMKRANIGLPFSKSIANRLAIINFIAGGADLKMDADIADDVKLLSSILTELNVNIDGVKTFNVGNNGAVCRFLMALLSVSKGEFILDGDLRMRKRPVDDLVKALKVLGADIVYEETFGSLPLRIKGKLCKGGNVDVDCSKSSQFVSALMLVAPCFEEGVNIIMSGEIVSESYIFMTSKLMSGCGVSATISNRNVFVEKGQGYCCPVFSLSSFIEKDWSAASYWYLANAISPAGTVINMEGLKFDSMQGDSILNKIFKNFGVESVESELGVSIYKTDFSVSYFDFDFSSNPDLVQTVAVTCAALGINAILRNVGILVFKETDRIEALSSQLSKIGCICSFDGKNILLESGGVVNDFCFRSYDDHRMIMAFSMLAIKLPYVEIDDCNCVSKSYPLFFDELKKIGIFECE